MSQYPHSPYGKARQAVDAFREGRLSQDGFLAQLDALLGRVENWRLQLDAIRSDDYPEGRELIEDARESLAAVCEGVDILRVYAQDRSEEAASEGLELVAEASDFLAQLLDITEQNMEDLENEL